VPVRRRAPAAEPEDQHRVPGRDTGLLTLHLHLALAFDGQVGAEDTLLVESVQRGVRGRLIVRGRLLLDSEALVDSFEKRLFAELS
jgi:hypothetical protein